ncbi:2-hydroxyacid dehydrogenase [Epilithonimonas lactis]|uniref:2-hydroxyacid dehydrogenase n=1 Tax=Epilithonimonas lactis TaxID=421072 RepID=A0A085BLV4_9FLAO|nr:2-hydroxyacid dehydrogenase [Epilithonimonas lactis]KFC23449.1 2-hydroxyacid dehydrogenase [Epilithonimonas lactis]SEQ13597.1 D-lactate dehydrogenase [Epilithonimonas lactis]
MKITFFSTKPYDKEFFDKVNKDFNFELEYFETHLGPHILNVIEHSDAVCAFVNDTLNAEVLESLSKKGMKYIALRCAGFNNVDLEAAKRLGIRVSRVPAYSPEAVAEHAMAMILTLNRKTHKAYNRVREQNFSLNGLMGFNLYQKTIGVIGTGNIGTAFAKIAKGFGAKILAYDITENQELKDLGIEYVSMDELLSQSDIISLHCPLMDATHHLINKESISKMKENVMLINTSRGGLIDTKAVIDGLKSKHIGYLGIDVYEQEEKLFFRDLSHTIIEDDTIQRLMSFPNVLVTAHQAFFTEEALHQIATSTLTSLSNFEANNEFENPNAVLV